MMWWRLRLKRIRCWLRGYHVRGRLYKFRYDVSGICDDCGVVGSGIPYEGGE